MQIIGYHGTTKEAAVAMCRMEFKFQREDFHWLGNGLYFFQDAPYRAWEWTATYLRDIKKSKAEPAVVRAVIEVAPREFIDLLDIQWMDIIRNEYISQIKIYEKDGKPVPKQKSIKDHLEKNSKVGSAPHQLDCDIIDQTIRTLKSKGIHIRATRAALIEGKALFDESHLYDRAHVEIAVHDTSIIKACLLEKKPRDIMV